MTVCNMSIEAGATAGLVAPDDTTFAYLEGRAHAPKGAAWERPLDDWRTLRTDAGAVWDKQVAIDASALTPHVTWGTNPGQVAVDRRRRPVARRLRRSRRPARPSRERSSTWASHAGTPIRDIARRHRVHRVVHEQPHRGPARRGRGASRAAHVTVKRVMVVPGSHAVKAQAEAEGLDRIFTRRRRRLARARAARCAWR